MFLVGGECSVTFDQIDKLSFFHAGKVEELIRWLSVIYMAL